MPDVLVLVVAGFTLPEAQDLHPVRRRPKRCPPKGDSHSKVPRTDPGQLAPEQGPQPPPSEEEDSGGGCHLNGPERVRTPRRARRRLRKRKKKRLNRTTRRRNMDKYIILVGMLCNLQLGDGASLRSLPRNKDPSWVYWAAVPGLPAAQPAAWEGDSIELSILGEAALVLGGSGGGYPESRHDLHKTVHWSMAQLPICLTKGANIIHCAQVQNESIQELPHGPHGSMGLGNYIHMYMLNHSLTQHHPLLRERMQGLWNSTQNTRNTVVCNSSKDFPCDHLSLLNATGSFLPSGKIPCSPPPPCVPTPNMFIGMQVCSTGHAVMGQQWNDTQQIYFMDGAPGPYYAAPVPHVLARNGSVVIQSHLWKMAAAFGNITHMTDNSGPLTDNDTIRSQWWDLIMKKGFTCHEGQVSGHCNRFSLAVQTLKRTDMFLICREGNITQTGGKYNVSCSNGTLSNTLTPNDVHSNTTFVILLSIPPVTFLPVGSDEAFADSDFLRAVMIREKRGLEISAIDMVGLVVSFIEQMEISAMQRQVHVMAADLADFMTTSTRAWALQQQINRQVALELSALTDAVQAISTLLRVNAILEGLPCHVGLARPLCMTALRLNASQELDDAIRRLQDHRNLEVYIERLDDIVRQIRNVTEIYKRDLEKQHGTFLDWISRLDFTTFLHTIGVAAGMVIIMILLCVLLPCFISCMIKVWRKVLEQVKADVLVIKQKGGVDGGRS
ncbi:uncharacterized protein [Notamacropus eugenii]|uniref:uncharacterized protein n=1 Tax=Notamacropus eugenii TaxID=9315 RepID=UPI003B67BD4F